MNKKGLSILLAAVMTAAMATPASALIKGGGVKEKTEQAPASTKTAAGAFTGSTALSRYLYEKFSESPASLTVPVNLFSAKGTDQRFEELGDAAIEAYIQNGLTDYVENFKYSYRDGDPAITMHIDYDNKDAADRRAKSKALDQKAAQIVASVTADGMTIRQKAEALNNYVAQNVTYDFEAFRAFQAGQNVYGLQTAYAGIVEGKAICQGFARAYKLLCDKAGVPCVVLFGTTKQFGTTHAWCRVNLDGKWETVDPTNPQLAINHVGSFCIPPDVVSATLQPDGNKTLIDARAADYLA